MTVRELFDRQYTVIDLFGFATAGMAVAETGNILWCLVSVPFTVLSVTIYHRYYVKANE